MNVFQCLMHLLLAAICALAGEGHARPKLQFRSSVSTESSKVYSQQCNCTFDKNYGINGSSFLRNGFNAEWAGLLASVRLEDIYSAPAHSHLRNPPTVACIAQSISADNGLRDTYRNDWVSAKMWIDVTTREDHVCHVELRDGNHRMAAAIMSGVWQTIGDLSKLNLVKISLNGNWPRDHESAVPTHEEFWPRLVPVQVGEEAAKQCTSFSFKRLQGNRGQMDALVPKDFTSISCCLTDNRGVPLEKVLQNTKASLSGVELNCSGNSKEKSEWDWREFWTMFGGFLSLLGIVGCFLYRHQTSTQIRDVRSSTTELRDLNLSSP
eukprot:TRINITY_DN10306_c0_g1_i2.p1 TRINITY_DN10306_c0_g1~~TRINITY_DN10306_c0_g1_i2.p1  ORF type:complete len:323 (-),score=34.35 TRINITY_DN10306_c0_g1_i2:333-1301(-)